MDIPKPLSREFLLYRQSCCGSKCLNCPYLPKHTTGSKQTAESILAEPVSHLKYYGLQIRTINTLELHGYYTIGDLRRLQECNEIRNLDNNGRQEEIRDALSSYLRGDPPQELPFDNTTSNYVL